MSRPGQVNPILHGLIKFDLHACYLSMGIMSRATKLAYLGELC